MTELNPQHNLHAYFCYELDCMNVKAWSQYFLLFYEKANNIHEDLASMMTWYMAEVQNPERDESKEKFSQYPSSLLRAGTLSSANEPTSRSGYVAENLRTYREW